MASITYIMGKRGGDNPEVTLKLTISNAKKVQSKVRGITVVRAYWDDEKEEMKTTSKFISPKDKMDMELTNKKLKNLRDEILLKAAGTIEDEITKEWLKREIDMFLYPEKYAPKVEKPKTLMEAVKAYIEAAEVRNIAQRTRFQYGQLNSQLCEFLKGQDKETNELDRTFYYEFVAFLYNKGYKKNTVGYFIKNLKAVLNSLPFTQRASCELLHDKECKKEKEDVANIYLTEDELSKIADLELSGHLDKARDQFLLLCWTGCRYSDLGKLNKDNIITRNGREYFKIEQQKTQATPTIPVFPVVRAILEKYDYCVPKPMSDQKLNSYIKEVAQLAGLDGEVKITHTEKKNGKVQRVMRKYKQWECVKVHTARRSFATNMYLRNFPTLMIMRITGHRTEKAFLTYIKITEDENAERMMKQFEEMEKRVKEQ